LRGFLKQSDVCVPIHHLRGDLLRHDLRRSPRDVVRPRLNRQSYIDGC
jgi:hypothetical protein